MQEAAPAAHHPRDTGEPETAHTLLALHAASTHVAASDVIVDTGDSQQSHAHTHTHTETDGPVRTRASRARSSLELLEHPSVDDTYPGDASAAKRASVSGVASRHQSASTHTHTRARTHTDSGSLSLAQTRTVAHACSLSSTSTGGSSAGSSDGLALPRRALSDLSEGAMSRAFAECESARSEGPAAPSRQGARGRTVDTGGTDAEAATAREGVDTEAASMYITPKKPTVIEYTDTVLATYVHDMYESYRQDEEALSPRIGYMRFQTEVNPRMRAILVDWLVDVYQRYRQHPETFYLAVSIVDRVLHKFRLPRKMLQLVGATALLIASKYSETFRRDIALEHIVFVCDNSYTTADVLHAERLILSKLDFRIGVPTAFTFFARLAKEHESALPDRCMWLAAYVIERAQLDYDMLRFRPSALAAAGVLFAARVLTGRTVWGPRLASTTGYTPDQLHACLCALTHMMRRPVPQDGDLPPLDSVYRKFSQPWYGAVATTVAFPT